MQGSGDILEDGIERVQFEGEGVGSDGAGLGSRASGIGPEQAETRNPKPETRFADLQSAIRNPQSPPPIQNPKSKIQNRAVPPRRAPGGGWTLMFLCAGLGIVAACVLIPQIDQNRRLMWDQARLRLDLEQIKKQVALGDQFVKKVADDPALAERLAIRQMKLIRKDSSVLELKGQSGTPDLSPLALVSVPPPPPLPDYQPVGGKLASLCRDPHKCLYLIGVGLMLMATGLVLGYAPRRAA